MARAVILAAGFGSRLMPLTSDRPKGMVSLLGMPMLARQVAVLRTQGISEIWIVGGYLAQRLETLGLPVIQNPAYETTNMVESLMCARALMDGTQDLVMAYGDIVYEPAVLETLLREDGDVVVTADRGWRHLWSARMENYALDVETFRLREDGCVAELGRRPKSLDDLEAQYVGLVRFPAHSHARLLAFYDRLDREGLYDGQPFLKMYMTSFIQHLIDAGWNVRPAIIENGWLEVDTLEDLRVYEALASTGGLAPICELQAPPEPAQLLSQLLNSHRDGWPGTCEPGMCDVLAVSSRLLDEYEPSFETGDMLDRLARKIEITGTLHRQYSIVEARLVPREKLATPEEIAILLAAYVTAFDRTRDWRHLNTVLKAIDGTLRQQRIARFHELDYLCAHRLREHG
jgi:choline kinase